MADGLSSLTAGSELAAVYWGPGSENDSLPIIISESLEPIGYVRPSDLTCGRGSFGSSLEAWPERQNSLAELNDSVGILPSIAMVILLQGDSAKQVWKSEIDMPCQGEGVGFMPPVPFMRCMNDICSNYAETDNVSGIRLRGKPPLVSGSVLKKPEV
jgi:hypothetical protein